jgi:hypothetical protein
VSFKREVKIHQVEAPVAGNSQPIAKIGNDELVHFNEWLLTHELI